MDHLALLDVLGPCLRKLVLEGGDGALLGLDLVLGRLHDVLDLLNLSELEVLLPLEDVDLLILRVLPPLEYLELVLQALHLLLGHEQGRLGVVKKLLVAHSRLVLPLDLPLHLVLLSDEAGAVVRLELELLLGLNVVGVDVAGFLHLLVLR